MYIEDSIVCWDRLKANFCRFVCRKDATCNLTPLLPRRYGNVVLHPFSIFRPRCGHFAEDIFSLGADQASNSCYLQRGRFFFSLLLPDAGRDSVVIHSWRTWQKTKKGFTFFHPRLLKCPSEANTHTHTCTHLEPGRCYAVSAILTLRRCHTASLLSQQNNVSTWRAHFQYYSDWNCVWFLHISVFSLKPVLRFRMRSFFFICSNDMKLQIRLLFSLLLRRCG